MTAANVIDRICGLVKEATTAVVLTHNIDFLFIQSVLLPRLRGVGHPKLTILADSGCASGSFKMQRHVIEGLGSRYRVVSIDLGPGRRFHPKAFLLAGPQGAALAVGSGNLTHGGWSANREIWSDFVAPGEGSPAISAFREYLTSILQQLPSATTVIQDVMAAFDANENPWVPTLPESDGLIWAPSDIPILDRMLAKVGTGVEAVTLISPYFDDDAVALSEIANRTGVTVMARLQPKRAGLSSKAAAALPSSVSLGRVDSHDSEGRQRFIHAKLYAFKKSETTFIVAGSANCSRAGLMANGAWGNAELVATQEIPNAELDAVLSELETSDQLPELPESAPSEEWEFDTVPLRILAARRDGRKIELAFKGNLDFTELTLDADGVLTAPLNYIASAQTATFLIDGKPQWVRIHGRTASGASSTSEPMWVDDEEALGISVPERRLRERLQNTGRKAPWTPSEYLEILELFDQHLRQPTKARHVGTGTERSKTEGSAKYTPADVFSDGFGKAPPTSSSSGGRAEFRDEDFLSLFMFFFDVERKAPDYDQTSQSPTPTEDEDKPEEQEKKLLKRERKDPNATPSAALQKRLARVLSRVVEAMSEPTFVPGRPAARLAADLGSTALLLRKALSDSNLTPDEYRNWTARLWQILFFGPDGQGGSLVAHVDQLKEKNAFIAEMASPRLSAAMALWCMTQWGGQESDAAWFRISAAQLTVRLPWLAAGGSPEDITQEISRMATMLRPEETQEDLTSAWRRWIRSATALGLLYDVLKGRSAKELAALCSRSHIRDGELLWQGGKLHVTVGDCQRTGNATVRALGRQGTTKFKGTMLAPITDILNSGLGLPPVALEELRELLTSASPD